MLAGQLTGFWIIVRLAQMLVVQLQVFLYVSRGYYCGHFLTDHMMTGQAVVKGNRDSINKVC